MEASLNSSLGRTALGQETLRIGRASDNTLVISDPQSSSHHAEITPAFGGNSYQIIDLNSTNGTFVNEQRLTANTPHQLNAGDVIRIGALRFTYEASSGYAPTVAASGGYAPTVAASGGYAPTVAASPFHSEPTVANQGQAPQPLVYPQSTVPADNYNASAPPPFTPATPQPGGFAPQGYPQLGSVQPGYPPASFGQPAYPQPKKSRVGLWIGLIVLLLLLVIGGGFGGYVYANRSTPEKTLQAYCTALQKNDAQGLYKTLSSETQAKTDINKISTGLQLYKLLFGGFRNCTFSNVTQSGSTATAIVTLTPMRARVVSQTASLVYENGQWKISSGGGVSPT